MDETHLYLQGVLVLLYARMRVGQEKGLRLKLLSPAQGIKVAAQEGHWE